MTTLLSTQLEVTSKPTCILLPTTSPSYVEAEAEFHIPPLIDVKDLKTYQQVYIYVIPMITNLIFINIVVVVARLYWFQQRLKNIAKERTLSRSAEDLEAGPPDQEAEVRGRESALDETHAQQNTVQTGPSESKQNETVDTGLASGPRETTITFEENLPNRGQSSVDNAVLHVPGPRDRDDGQSMIEIRQDRESIDGYFVGLHVFGVICLLPWILHAPPKYKSWLLENGQGQVWWAFYSAQTMVDNLGFTLTPDSMSTFKDATWPMLAMTFLAFAGNTIYPVLLRLVIWVMSRVVNKKSATKEHLEFLLDHPRRCYTLLFPSRPTWILFGIVFLLNFIDVLLIIVLDLDNPAVNDLAMGPRILSALFQAASSRHTGTSTLNLSLVNPAVQFSLLCMMYIAIFPIAISIRASNTYEERALGVYEADSHLDETNGASYVMAHIRNQLSFDLWYIFLGTFCICIAESQRIMDLNEPVRTIFTTILESQC
ncbi:Low-affinity potassium transport protein [Colletotrichum sp. SAR11_59]|nr:Low-affinity potassium transport protein [Colletotrichum sp. SAR11_59]